MEESSQVQHHELRGRVAVKQLHMKTYTDAKRRAKTPKLYPGILGVLMKPCACLESKVQVQ